MANVLKKTTLEYKESVNTPDYPSSDWLINPDMSAVVNVPRKYWKLVGNNVVEMTQTEKDAVDAEILQRQRDKVTDLDMADLKIVLTAFVEVINTRLAANKQITKQELIDAIKAKIQ